MGSRAKAWTFGIALSLGLTCVVGDCGSPQTFGTFNIRVFPSRTTLPERVAERIAEMDADAFAVQEIMNPHAFREMLAEASRLTHRSYEVAFGGYCQPGPGEDPRMAQARIGVVYDAEVFSLTETRDREQLDPQGRNACGRGYPAAMLALLERDDGERTALMSVHLKCCGGDDNHARRREEWRHLVDSFETLERELDAPLVVMGDFNSVGIKDNVGGERDFIGRMLDDAGLRLLTDELPCTEYWVPPGGNGSFATSLLDHVLVRRGVGEFDAPAVHGMCAELSCESRRHPDFEEVSDHCPVTVRKND